jgi:hypothetical protein
VRASQTPRDRFKRAIRLAISAQRDGDAYCVEPHQHQALSVNGERSKS